MNNGINIITDSISIITVLVIFVSSMRKNNRNEEDGGVFFGLMICLLAVLLLDIPAWALNGKVFYSARTICYILDSASYVMQIVYCRLWLMYTDRWLTGAEKRSVLVRVLCSIPMIVEIVVVAYNVNNGVLFTIDENNIYTRGPMYELNMIPYSVYILFTLGITAYGTFAVHDNEKRRRNRSLLLYLLLPSFGALLNVGNYGNPWLWPFTSLSLLMVYMNIQTRRINDERIATVTQTAKTAQLENELADSRIKIMLSQIQPHFMYNSLSVIHALCDIDPAAAANAIDDFSDYLRCNMDSLYTDKLIPFIQEMNHVMHYLSLEKLRFQDALDIRYSISVTDFSLPALSLQPIVENAVRYGITKSEYGGLLTVSTRETTEKFIISVKDTGVGFDISEVKSDGRSHIGIENVRKRLETMCDGSLEIISTRGAGTEAIITIPKAGVYNDSLRS